MAEEVKEPLHSEQEDSPLLHSEQKDSLSAEERKEPPLPNDVHLDENVLSRTRSLRNLTQYAWSEMNIRRIRTYFIGPLVIAENAKISVGNASTAIEEAFKQWGHKFTLHECLQSTHRTHKYSKLDTKGVIKWIFSKCKNLDDETEQAMWDKLPTGETLLDTRSPSDLGQNFGITADRYPEGVQTILTEIDKLRKSDEKEDYDVASIASNQSEKGKKKIHHFLAIVWINVNQYPDVNRELSKICDQFPFRIQRGNEETQGIVHRIQITENSLYISRFGSWMDHDTLLEQIREAVKTSPMNAAPTSCTIFTLRSIEFREAAEDRIVTKEEIEGEDEWRGCWCDSQTADPPLRSRQESVATQSVELRVLNLPKVDDNPTQFPYPESESKEDIDIEVKRRDSRFLTRLPTLKGKHVNYTETDEASLQFAICSMQTEAQAKRVMRQLHGQYVFSSENTSRFELMGHSRNLRTPMTHGVQAQVLLKRNIYAFGEVFLKLLCFPLSTFVWPLLCVAITALRHRCSESLGDSCARVWLERSRHGYFPSFDLRLRKQPMNLFRPFRSLFVEGKFKTKPKTAISWAILLFLLSSFAYTTSIVGPFLYGDQNDHENPLPFHQTWFLAVFYGWLTLLIAVSTARQTICVTGFEHPLLYHNMYLRVLKGKDVVKEQEMLDPTKEDASEFETDESEFMCFLHPDIVQRDNMDYHALVAVREHPDRVSLIQYMHQTGMLSVLKKYPSPFGSLANLCGRRLFWYHSKNHANVIPSCNCWCLAQWVVNFICYALLIASVLIENLFLSPPIWNRHERPDLFAFSGLALVTLTIYYVFFLWVAATMFTRSGNYLHAIEKLGALQSNKLRGYFLTFDEEKNVKAWWTMRQFMVRAGQLVFYSIELNFIFIFLAFLVSFGSLTFSYSNGSSVDTEHELLGNAAFVSWAFWTLTTLIHVSRFLYVGAKLEYEQEGQRRKVRRQKTLLIEDDWQDEKSFEQDSAINNHLVNRLDIVIDGIADTTVVPKVFGLRVNKLYFRALVAAFLSSVPTLLQLAHEAIIKRRVKM